MSLRRPLAVVLVGLALVASGCGDPPVTKDQFVDQMRSITSGKDRATPELAGCIYDRIADDRDLLEAASSGSDLPKRQEDQLARITSDCWKRVNTRDKGSKRTTTTTRSRSSDSPSSGSRSSN